MDDAIRSIPDLDTHVSVILEEQQVQIIETLLVVNHVDSLRWELDIKPHNLRT